MSDARSGAAVDPRGRRDEIGCSSGRASVPPTRREHRQPGAHQQSGSGLWDLDEVGDPVLTIAERVLALAQHESTIARHVEDLDRLLEVAQIESQSHQDVIDRVEVARRVPETVQSIA